MCKFEIYVYLCIRSFNLNFRYMATRKHTNTHTYTRDSQCNYASVGLAQARPKLTFSVCCQSCSHVVRSVLEPFPCSTAGTSAGSVRLVGDSRSRGLVEVFYNGRWGAVCSSLWGTTEARVVCAELGFNRNDGSRYISPG